MFPYTVKVNTMDPPSSTFVIPGSEAFNAQSSFASTIPFMPTGLSKVFYTH